MAEHNRRSLLRWAIFGLGAVFTAILGFPAIAYLIDPRHRGGAKGDFRLVDGIKIADLQQGQPKQGFIRDVRRDAWTLHPTDVIGRVWVVKLKDVTRPDPAKKDDPDMVVMTTVCPHLGCSVNMKVEGGAPTGFSCPCHNGQFDLNGARSAVEPNPPPRGMDTLDWQIDPANADKLLVRYVNFRQLEKEKIEKT
ncbi:MAG: ubiquinol-cytochrome c reductase iron-sulfur subunit [Gemmataceae bacterium]